MATDQAPDNNECANHDDQRRAVASCLLNYLNVHGKSKQLFSILRFLAEETLSNLEEGKTPHFNYFAIRTSVTGETQGDASAWFSRYWKEICGDFKLRCEEGIQKFAADQGLSFYPWIQKLESDGGAGNQALISLVALPLSAPVTTDSIKHFVPKHDIAYIPAEKLELSWWAKLLFDQNRIAGGWRKWILILGPIVWATTIGLGGVFLLYLLGLSATPVTTRDVVLLIYLGLLVWYASRLIRRFTHLVDDRMIVASETMITSKESGVCLELFRPNGGVSDAPKIARMIKYAAQCPICGAQVLLDRGEPDFPRRIVGRCQESPREHVFSFDRTLMTGRWLRRLEL
ncbi:hypothetical protein GCM10027046_13300 [Uliginosibacterium flavum]|uniref:Uncharacterized protein n=1 Tax=Uliginosibacterium flavum TaxID=1396831 RepID=A0ABV2TQ10_9RHOO